MFKPTHTTIIYNTIIKTATKLNLGNSLHTKCGQNRLGKSNLPTVMFAR